MKDKQNIFPQDIYIKHLSLIKDIHFTAREIDIIACIISARRTSKIAFLLSINPRTVETHIRNIMVKLNCNSQETIIDFIESSDKLFFLRKYYSLLKLMNAFEKSLSIISKLPQEKKPICLLIQKGTKNNIVPYLEEHLKRVGIKTYTSSHKEKADYIIYILSDTPEEEEIPLALKRIKQDKNKFLFLTFKSSFSDASKTLLEQNVIDFTKQEDYYFSFFNLLKKLLPNVNFESIRSDFKDKYNVLTKKTELSNVLLNKENSENLLAYQKRFYILLAVFLTLMITSGFFALQLFKKDKNISFRSDLVLPRESVLLERSEILKELKEKFQEKKIGIQTIALVGVGGAGKTTLARQYAHQKKRIPIWEINAETQETLYTSFKKLAHALATTEKDQKILKEAEEVGDFKEKENRIIYFVKERLHSHPNWLLIYDNVATFESVQKYFPCDSDTWGNGHIILTTRDDNIRNNKCIDHTIFVGELNSNQKFMLFKKIMSHDSISAQLPLEKPDILSFLDKIPSFPLDVSIAAYYLKATNVPFSTYLENLTHFNKNFTHIQENILKEVGEYSKVRYCIITSSLKKILEENNEFDTLLFTLFLLDSQNVPMELLNTLKNDVLVSDFILNLKKYSLLTSGTSNHSSSAGLSIHRSTQAIGLYYLQQTLGIQKSKELVKSISEKLISYIEKVVVEEGVAKMKFLIPHYEAILKHKDLLTGDIEGLIKGQLGILHYFLGDNLKAVSFLEESLSLLDKYSEEYPTYVALFMGYLGNALRDLGHYEEAKLLIEKAILIYEKHYPKDNYRHAYFLVYLGIIERYLGHYDAAQNTFEKGLIISKKHFPKHENYKAWVSGQLAILEREFGNYAQAKKGLEASLKIFEKDRVSDHFDIAWALEHLGVVYTKLNQHTQAQEALERSLRIYAGLLPDQIGPLWILALCDPLQSSKNDEDIINLFNQLLEIYKNHFHDNYIYAAYPLSQLGNHYIEIGNYQKAKLLLEQSLSIYQKNYGEFHLILAPILNDLGLIYFLEGKLEDSEKLLRKALEIFQSYNHIGQYSSLERLSDLLLKKS